MSDYTEIVARVRAYTEHPALDDEALALGQWSLANDGTSSRLVTYGDLRTLCDTVERLERERDAERQAREQTFAWYDERRAEVLRLTAEVERLRGALALIADTPEFASSSNEACAVMLDLARRALGGTDAE